MVSKRVVLGIIVFWIIALVIGGYYFNSNKTKVSSTSPQAASTVDTTKALPASNSLDSLTYTSNDVAQQANTPVVNASSAQKGNGNATFWTNQKLIIFLIVLVVSVSAIPMLFGFFGRSFAALEAHRNAKVEAVSKSIEFDIDMLQKMRSEKDKEKDPLLQSRKEAVHESLLELLEVNVATRKKQIIKSK